MYDGCSALLARADACGPPRADAEYRACLRAHRLDTEPVACTDPRAHAVRCDAAGYSTHVHGCSTRAATRETVYGKLHGAPSFLVTGDGPRRT